MLLILPGVFDIIETSFKNITLTLVAASITQMLRSSVVLFTAMLAMIFLKKRLFRHHITSLFLIVGGIVMVGLAAESGNKSTNIWGFIVLLIGQFSGAVGYVVEEKFLGDFEDLDPIMMAGIEGVWSLAIWLVVLPIL